MATAVPLPTELAEGEPRLVVHDGVPYCVIRCDGATHAFVAVCAHKDRAMVPLRRKAGFLVCPHHGVTFRPDTGEVLDDRGYDMPHGLVPVEVRDIDSSPTLRARKRHRKLLSKKERKRVAKERDRPAGCG